MSMASLFYMTILCIHSNDNVSRLALGLSVRLSYAEPNS